MKVRPDTPEQAIARKLYEYAAALVRDYGWTDDSVKTIRAAAHLLWTGVLKEPMVMQAHVLPDDQRA